MGIQVWQPAHVPWIMWFAAALALLFVGLSRRSSGVVEESHKRGTTIRTAGRRRRRRELSLAGTGVKLADEAKHFKLLGTTGTGKSTAIAELVGGALGRGDRAVFTDPDGGYLQRFYERERGDVVLNPFEPGTHKWDLFAEIRKPYDVEQLASGLIPNCSDSNAQEWRGYARTLLSAVLRRCYLAGNHDTAELWRLLVRGTSKELRAAVAGSPAQPFLEGENARMFASIRSVMLSSIAALEHVQAQRAPNCSIRDWMSSGRGVLFLPYQAVQIAALRSIIATWTRLAIFEAMDRPDDSRRLWFVVDELDALGAIEGLKDALTRLRKFGGRCVLGIQSIAQVSSTYGAGEAQTIVENCANTLILRCSGSENGGTSHFASRLIGEREVIRKQTSLGRDREGWFGPRGRRQSTTTSRQHVTELAVMASEIEQLPDFQGYLKTASSPGWSRVALPLN